MMLYLLTIQEIKNFGVLITAITESGEVREIRQEYTPWMVTVGLPKRYYKDSRKATVEATNLKRPFVGFCEGEQDVVKFRTHQRDVSTWRRYAHEVETPLVRQFCEERKLYPGWFDSESMQSVHSKTVPPNVLVASYDAECYSKSRDFPDASKESDCVTMIATSFQRLLGGPIKRHVVSLDAEASTSATLVVEQCNDEESMLQRFAEVINEHNPDFVIGYNTDGFDNGYINTRVKDKARFYKSLSRYPGISASYRCNTITNNQSGSMQRGRLYIPGRVCLDLLPHVRDHNKTLKFDRRYPSCKLDDVCKQELNAQKTGFSYEEIFAAHETKDPVANGKLVEYNVQDCDLVLALETKLQIILGLLQLSEISLTPVQDVVYRGVTCRVMNMFSQKAHAAGYYLNHQQINDTKEFKDFTNYHKRKRDDEEQDNDKSKFQGAHCFPVVAAVHTDNVLGVDYAALYPSIIRRYNICPTLLVLSQTTRPSTRRQLSDNKNEFATFVISEAEAPVPQLLTELTNARRDVKRQMKNAKNQTEYVVLNKRQLAIKIMSNSCYGFMGSSNSGGLGHPELAAAVTAYGRDLIRGVANYIIETYPGAKIVGGDTDSVYFTLPQDGNELVKSFKIGEDICTAIGKKFGAPIELEMEKVYKPMCYVAKKTYAAIMYESPDTEGKIDVKGMALVKGDSSPLTSALQLDIIKVIMQTQLNAWPTVEALVKSAIASIKTIDKSVLVKSVKLGSNYKNPDTVTSVQVAKKMKARGQQEPQPGELVPFLVSKTASKRVSDRADHPDHVLHLDYTYYIDRQIIKPLTRILDVLKGNWRESIIY